MKDYKFCVCFLYGWLDNCKISGSGCGWKTATALPPCFRSFSQYTQLLYPNHLHHRQTLSCSEAASKKGRKQGKWKRGERESNRGGRWALKASSCLETLRRSLPFLQTADKPSLQWGERDRQTRTHTCV